MTTTTKRPEVVHDERYLELLWQEHVARLTVATKAHYLIGSAADDERGPVLSGIVYQGATFARGPAGDSGYFLTAKLPTRVRATVDDARPFVERLAEPGDIDGIDAYDRQYGSKRPEKAQERLDAYDEAVAEVQAIREAIRVQEAGYTGWSRYMLVTSSAGHVHRNMECTTCYPTTTYALVPSLSGATDDEAVAELGETLCTVCFPDAPVKPSKITQAQALTLLEHGEEAFVEARAKAVIKAEKRAADKAAVNARRAANGLPPR